MSTTVNEGRDWAGPVVLRTAGRKAEGGARRPPYRSYLVSFIGERPKAARAIYGHRGRKIGEQIALPGYS